MAVAKALGSSAESINESLQALANTKKRWLLVLDNADDPGFDYATYIPSGAQGAVIITSRVPDCGRYSTIGSEALEGLDLQHSTQLLLKAARVPEKSWLCCKTQAQDVVVLLGSHTLALIQAGAYIAEGYCELAQYPKKFQQQRKRLLKHHPEQEQSRYRDIYTTFEASADVLEHAKGEAGTDALDLLAILSMLHSSLLPLEVFADAWTGARRVHQAKRTETDEIGAVGQQHVSRLPELVSMETDEWDDYRLKRASALLASLSLVTRHCLDGFDGLTMHPLAHAWAKDRLGKERQQQAWVSVGCLLALSRRHSETWHTSERESKMWEMYERELRPHLQSFLLPGLKTAFSYEPQKVILPIILKCGWALNAMREDNGLQSLLEGLHWDLQITQSNPSEEHLPIWDLTARNLRYMGKTRHAVALLEHVIKVRKTTLAETHPDRLASQHELARAYKAHGQIKEAIELLEHTVKVQKTTLAEPHPNQLHSQHELAGAYMANGQIKEAVELLEHVVRVRRTSLAETHPDQLASQNNLANAYEANGQIKEAVELLEHVVRIRKTSLVETHSDRLVSQNNLANAYRANGQIKEAVELLEHVVGVRKASLAETHPDRLVSQHALASAYQANGQIKEAIELLEHVVRVRRTSLAETHPDQLASQNNLANAYEANGQIKEAVELLEHVVGVRKASLAETHPDRLVSQHALASAYQANGQIKEAIELLEHVVEVEKTTLAETHPDRLVSQHNLASAYKANGQIEEALELIEHVVKVQKTTLAETHPSRQLSERMLLSILRARDRRARDRRARFS
jgi:tetratricopeptide (TPR) repeat protein